MNQKTKPSPASPGDASPWSLLGQIVGKINVPVFLFAIAIIIVVALLGRNIPTAFQVLIYLVVLLALGIYVFQVAAPVVMQYQEKKRRQASLPAPILPERAKGPSPPPAPERRAVPAHLEDYLAWLAPRCNRLHLAVIDPSYTNERGESRICLDDVYTDLDTETRIPVEASDRSGHLRKVTERPGLPRAPEKHEMEMRVVSALEVVSQSEGRCVVLTGDPGSGKSTFLKRLGYCLSMSRLEPRYENDWLSKLSPWALGFRLPIFVTLLDLATRGLPSDPKAEVKAKHLEDFIRAELAQHALGGFADELFTMLWQDGGVLLLDGLDEVPQPGRRRVQIKQAVEDFATRFRRCRVIVTCRDYAYDDPRFPWRLAGFQRHRLAPFNRTQIEYFIDHWCNTAAPIEAWDTETAKSKAALFKAAVQPPASAAELAPRPILLQLMATLFARGGSLPEDRAELYRDTVRLLLDYWQKAKVIYRNGEPVIEGGLLDTLKVDRATLEQALYRVAYNAHKHQGKSADRRAQQAADIRERDLKADLEAVLHRDPAPAVQYVQQRAGLLVSKGGHLYAFSHRSFQEYLAACHLAGLGNFPEQMARHVLDDLDWWREVFLLAAGQSSPFLAVTLITALCPQDCTPERLKALSDNWWRVVALAGEAAVETGLPALAAQAEREKGSAFYPTTRDRLAGWLAGLVQASTPSSRDRAAAGRALAHLDDPRPGVRRRTDGLPDIVWCEVPAGPFTMGNDKKDPEAYEDEFRQDVEKSITRPYFIGRYPVTNAQFTAFVQDGGYTDPKWLEKCWTQAGRRWLKKNRVTGPERYGNPFDLPNHPVLGVSWYEALAFCRWLSEKLRTSSGDLQLWRDGQIETIRLKPEPFEIRLPTEAQWEKAARGTDGLIYPWGSDFDPAKCNVAETGIGSTSAVGILPGGDSPYGCADMSGNVWEWCSTKWVESYKDYDKGAEDREKLEGDDPRVVRGGSWGSPRRSARCASRGGYYPGYRAVSYGFRVVGASGSP